jgi:hypothetical protein
MGDDLIQVIAEQFINMPMNVRATDMGVHGHTLPATVRPH